MKKLTTNQKKAMQRHKKHHSSKHMREMTNLMTRSRNPLTFTQAHKTAIKKVGK
jgi:hypothetical protein